MCSLAAVCFDKTSQKAFAFGSGDYNPVHLDAVKARKSYSGQVVVHGIHVFLWAFDHLCRIGLIEQSDILRQQIRCKFKKTIFLGEEIKLFRRRNPKSNKNEFIVEKDRVQLVKIQLTQKLFRPKVDFKEVFEAYQVGESKKPLELDLHAIRKRNLRLNFGGLDINYFRKFSKLSEYISLERIRAIAVMSAAVGMIAPGQNSLFTSFLLSIDSVISDEDSGVLHVADFNPNHKLLDLFFSGSGIFSHIQALSLPKPISPPSSSHVQRVVSEEKYNLKFALIVGGSRGVGAIFARILANACVKTIITYNNGRDEAHELSADPYIECIHFDAYTTDISVFIRQLPVEVSALFYFVTPKIFFRRTKYFHKEKLDLFNHCYVKVFQELFIKLRDHSMSLKYVFYPSTVEVRKEKSLNLEYCEAKLNAEEICREFSIEFDNIKFFVPRLKKITTDQTAWLKQEHVDTEEILYVKSLLDQFLK